MTSPPIDHASTGSASADRASGSPTLGRRVLATELKTLRQAAGLTHVDVANRLGWQQGKVSKIENAGQGAGIEVVIALADVCEASPGLRDRLIELARTAHGRGWWESYRDVLGPSWRTYIGLENGADVIWCFGTEAVPDLAKTPDYAASTLGVLPLAAEGATVTRRSQVLRERQRHLVERRVVELNLVLTESALRRAVGGPRVLREQLEHLFVLSGRSAVTVRVLPFSVGALPVVGPFTILGFRQALYPEVVFTPREGGGTCSEAVGEAAAYREALDVLVSLSLEPEESARFIEAREKEAR